jgi:hypothetical protein
MAVHRRPQGVALGWKNCAPSGRRRRRSNGAEVEYRHHDLLLEFCAACGTQAQNAFLTTDTGLTVSAVAWDAPSGGHHVSGVLSFPASLGDQGVLEGAEQVTLTIRNVDVPERVFMWEIQPAG